MTVRLCSLSLTGALFICNRGSPEWPENDPKSTNIDLRKAPVRRRAAPGGAARSACKCWVFGGAAPYIYIYIYIYIYFFSFGFSKLPYCCTTNHLKSMISKMPKLSWTLEISRLVCAT